MFRTNLFTLKSSSVAALGQYPDLSNFHPANADPREETLVRYTKGTGRFSRDKRYITLRMNMFLPDGTQDGYHEGVWEALFSDPSELFSRPSRPIEPMNQPLGPVQHLRPSAETEAIWSFGDGSAILAVGSAMSHLVSLDDGGALFMVACAQTITGGTGQYEGAFGLKTSLGSTYVPPGVNFFGPQDVQFEATTIDTFRIMRSTFVRRTQQSATRRESHNDEKEVTEPVPEREPEAIAKLTQIHLSMMHDAKTLRGPHRRHQGCVLAKFIIRNDVPEPYRIGIFERPRWFYSVIRFSSGGENDDRKPDAHAMSIKLLGVKGEKLLKRELNAETQDFILCDHPVFIVRNVEEMNAFEEARRLRREFSSGECEFAKCHPDEGAILRRFAESGFLKEAKPSPFEAQYWSQTPSKLGANHVVKYKAIPSPDNASGRAKVSGPNSLREAMQEHLVEKRRHAYFHFCINIQTDEVRFPVEDPTVNWDLGDENTIELATIDILPLSFDSPEQMDFCENLSFNPWHGLNSHRPIGGINRARRIVYEESSKLRHASRKSDVAEPSIDQVLQLWNLQ